MKKYIKYVSLAVIIIVAVLGVVGGKAEAQVLECPAGFTCTALPTVVQPNGGEVLEVGQSINVQWLRGNIPSTDYIDLQLVPASGSDSGPVYLNKTVLNDGEDRITIPSVPKGQYIIRLSSSGGELFSVFDKSDTPFTITSSNTTPCFTFTRDLRLGNEGPDVAALQKFLIGKGFDIPNLTRGQTPYGYFGGSTRVALQNYQRSVGIDPTGFFGPVTRALVNAGCVNNQQPSITVLTPNGGEIWEAGSTQTIKWTSNNIPSNQVLVQFSKGLNIVYSEYFSNIGSAQLTLPNIGTGSDFKLTVGYKNSAGVFYSDSSDNYFTITNDASISEQVKCVFSGATTEQKCYTSNTALSFGCSGIASCVVNVSGPKGTQLTWKSSCGGYAYTKIDGQTESVNFYCKTTPQPQPSITVVAPNGGEVITYDGTDQQIYLKWTQNYLSNQLSITMQDYNTGGVYYSRSVDNIGTGDNSVLLSPETFNVPTGQYRFTICDKNIISPQILCDFSDTSFTIARSKIISPSLSILTPNGGEIFKNDGSPITINWKSTGMSASDIIYDIRLRAYPNGGTYYLVNNTVNDGQEVIVPKNIPSGAYYLELKTVVSGVTIYDSSDSYFKLVDLNADKTTAVYNSLSPNKDLSVGVAVKTTDNLNVRSNAGGNILNTEPKESVGVISEGPVDYNGNTWYKINYYSGSSGWSVSNYLLKVQ